MKKVHAKSSKNRQRVTFTYFAPRAREVFVLGDFNGWDITAHPMMKDADGLWRKITYLSPGRYEYLFVEDGKWCCDPRNLDRCPNCYGSENNIIEVKRRK